MPSAKPVTVLVEGEDGKTKSMNQGRWSPEEHELFVEGYKRHGRQWKTLAEVITTRTVLQIRTHAQKYFHKLSKNAEKDPNGQASDGLQHHRNRANRIKKRNSKATTRRPGKQRKRPESVLRGDAATRPKRNKATAMSSPPSKKLLATSSKWQYDTFDLREPFRFFASDYDDMDEPLETKMDNVDIFSTPPRKFNPLADVSSPVSFTEFHDFLFPGSASNNSLLENPTVPNSLFDDADVIVGTDPELRAVDYRRQLFSMRPDIDDCGELDIQTLAKITESPNHHLLSTTDLSEMMFS